MKIGEKIAFCRKKAGFSQEELASRLGLSRQAVSRWETGAAVPDTEKVIALSGIFQVSTDYLLLDGIEEPETAGAGVAVSVEKAAPEKNALLERRRHFRIAFGAVLAVLGVATAVAALFLTQFYADSLTEWWTDLGRFGTALRSWRGGMLACGILVLAGGTGVLVREYMREE